MTPTLVQLAMQHATKASKMSYCHGPRHWKQVARMGHALLCAGVEADPSVVFAFAALHDTKRWTDGSDPLHGHRAARLARRLHAESLLRLDYIQLWQLCAAMEGHTLPTTTGDPTIGACWDADRLTLWRVNRVPTPSLLSTEHGKSDSLIHLGRAVVATDFHTWADVSDGYESFTSPLDYAQESLSYSTEWRSP